MARKKLERVRAQEARPLFIHRRADRYLKPTELDARRAELADRLWAKNRVGVLELMKVSGRDQSSLERALERGSLQPPAWDRAGAYWPWGQVAHLVNLLSKRSSRYNPAREEAEARLADEFEALLRLRISPTTTTLPTKPPKLFGGGQSGRPKAGASNALVTFIDEVYGPYMLEHRDNLRAYIHQHDLKLYRALINYERSHTLPPHLGMPSQRDQVRERWDRAVNSGLGSLAPKERRSVVSKLRRVEPH